MKEQPLDYREIGQNIRRYRKQCGFNQRKLAEAINVSAQHISHIESGQPVSLAALVAVCNVLSVPADRILGSNLHATFHDTQIEQAAQLLLTTNLSSQELSRFIAVLEALETQPSP